MFTTRVCLFESMNQSYFNLPQIATCQSHVPRECICVLQCPIEPYCEKWRVGAFCALIYPNGRYNNVDSRKRRYSCRQKQNGPATSIMPLCIGIDHRVRIFLCLFSPLYEGDKYLCSVSPKNKNDL